MNRINLIDDTWHVTLECETCGPGDITIPLEQAKTEHAAFAVAFEEHAACRAKLEEERLAAYKIEMLELARANVEEADRQAAEANENLAVAQAVLAELGDKMDDEKRQRAEKELYRAERAVALYARGPEDARAHLELAEANLKPARRR